MDSFYGANVQSDEYSSQRKSGVEARIGCNHGRNCRADASGQEREDKLTNCRKVCAVRSRRAGETVTEPM